MTDLILPDSRFEMPELYYPGRKPVGNVRINKSSYLYDSLELFLNLPNLQNLANGELAILDAGNFTMPVKKNDGIFFINESVNMDITDTSTYSPNIYLSLETYTAAAKAQTEGTFTFIIEFGNMTGTGPGVVFESGGSSNGICIIYRTGTRQFSFLEASGGTGTTVEHMFSKSYFDYIEDKKRHIITFVKKGLSKKVFFDGKFIEEITAGLTSIGAATSGSGLFGLGSLLKNTTGVSHAGGYGGGALDSVADPFSGVINTAIIHSTALSYSAVISLHNNQDKLLIPS